VRDTDQHEMIKQDNHFNLAIRELDTSAIPFPAKIVANSLSLQGTFRGTPAEGYSSGEIAVSPKRVPQGLA